MKILNKKQIEIISFFSQNDFLRENFYWTGGTALAELYLKHRLSEDLDFFSDDLYAENVLLKEMNNLKSAIGAREIKYLRNKNRQQFFVIFGNETIKLEFVYYPFGEVKSKELSSKYRIKVDSIESIGINKIFALYETADPKHAFDLYWIVKNNKNLSLEMLFSQVQRKFGVEIDKVILLEKALEAGDKLAKITPMIFKEYRIDKEKLVKFFSDMK